MSPQVRFTPRVAALAVASLAIVASVSIPYPARGADPSHDKTMKLPESAGDHLALAQNYEEKAAAWRQEAAHHREMAAAYRNSRPANDADAATMQKHCMKIVKDAEALATDADDTAKYHRLRAKELQGK